jgi:hypothetical protein
MAEAWAGRVSDHGLFAAARKASVTAHQHSVTGRAAININMRGAQRGTRVKTSTSGIGWFGGHRELRRKKPKEEDDL